MVWGIPASGAGRAGPLSVLAGTPGADLSEERAALGAAFVQTQNLPLDREVVGSRQGKPRASRAPSPTGLPSAVFSTFTQPAPLPSLPLSSLLSPSLPPPLFSPPLLLSLSTPSHPFSSSPRSPSTSLSLLNCRPGGGSPLLRPLPPSVYLPPFPRLLERGPPHTTLCQGNLSSRFCAPRRHHRQVYTPTSF